MLKESLGESFEALELAFVMVKDMVKILLVPLTSI